MVVVLFIRLTFARLKQVVACNELKDHARERPQVSSLIIFTVQNDLRTSVLACLNHTRIMVVYIARISHVANLNVEVQVGNVMEVLGI